MITCVVIQGFLIKRKKDNLIDILQHVMQLLIINK